MHMPLNHLVDGENDRESERKICRLRSAMLSRPSGASPPPASVGSPLGSGNTSIKDKQKCCLCSKPRLTSFSPSFIVCHACGERVAHSDCIPQRKRAKHGKFVFIDANAPELESCHAIRDLIIDTWECYACIKAKAQSRHECAGACNAATESVRGSETRAEPFPNQPGPHSATMTSWTPAVIPQTHDRRPHNQAELRGIGPLGPPSYAPSAPAARRHGSQAIRKHPPPRPRPYLGQLALRWIVVNGYKIADNGLCLVEKNAGSTLVAARAGFTSKLELHLRLIQSASWTKCSSILYLWFGDDSDLGDVVVDLDYGKTCNELVQRMNSFVLPGLVTELNVDQFAKLWRGLVSGATLISLSEYHQQTVSSSKGNGQVLPNALSAPGRHIKTNGVVDIPQDHISGTSSRTAPQRDQLGTSQNSFKSINTHTTELSPHMSRQHSRERKRLRSSAFDDGILAHEPKRVRSNAYSTWEPDIRSVQAPLSTVAPFDDGIWSDNGNDDSYTFNVVPKRAENDQRLSVQDEDSLGFVGQPVHIPRFPSGVPLVASSLSGENHVTRPSGAPSGPSPTPPDIASPSKQVIAQSDLPADIAVSIPSQAISNPWNTNPETVISSQGHMLSNEQSAKLNASLRDDIQRERRGHKKQDEKIKSLEKDIRGLKSKLEEAERRRQRDRVQGRKAVELRELTIHELKVQVQAKTSELTGIQKELQQARDETKKLKTRLDSMSSRSLPESTARMPIRTEHAAIQSSADARPVAMDKEGLTPQAVPRGDLEIENVNLKEEIEALRHRLAPPTPPAPVRTMQPRQVQEWMLRQVQAELEDPGNRQLTRRKSGSRRSLDRFHITIPVPRVRQELREAADLQSLDMHLGAGSSSDSENSSVERLNRKDPPPRSMSAAVGTRPNKIARSNVQAADSVGNGNNVNNNGGTDNEKNCLIMVPPRHNCQRNGRNKETLKAFNRALGVPQEPLPVVTKNLLAFREGATNLGTKRMPRASVAKTYVVSRNVGGVLR